MDFKDFFWIREPQEWKQTEQGIEIVTMPHTDLWQRTYYHFRNDNAPCWQFRTNEKYFSFTVKTSFKEANWRFDQCGILVYLNSDNWLKASIEYENGEYQHLGSVVTNNGYSDWATTNINASVKEMWYRLSRREADFKIECSFDGLNFEQMRICHLFAASDVINLGVYACSPEDSSFKAMFTNFSFGECLWLAHDGQQLDSEKECE